MVTVLILLVSYEVKFGKQDLQLVKLGSSYSTSDFYEQIEMVEGQDGVEGIASLLTVIH